MSFVFYAQDHLGDTYKFYDPPATKQTIMSRDVHQWIEWQGRITATNDLDLLTELEKLKTDSIILSASLDIPILSDENFPDNSAMPDLYPVLRSRRTTLKNLSLPVSPLLRGGI